VTVVSAFRPTSWQVTVLVVVQPLQEEKVLVEVVEGAVRVTFAPALYDTVKLVFAEMSLLVAAGDKPMVTPVAGLVELTVTV
jgi:hypothetical protein